VAAAGWVELDEESAADWLELLVSDTVVEESTLEVELAEFESLPLVEALLLLESVLLLELLLLEVLLLASLLLELLLPELLLLVSLLLATCARGVTPWSVAPACFEQTGHAPQPWLARTFSATAICWSRVAPSACEAYADPPFAAQVESVNWSPPWYPLPVLIAQLPVLSHCATASQVESGAAEAGVARPRIGTPIRTPAVTVRKARVRVVESRRCRPM